MSGRTAAETLAAALAPFQLGDMAADVRHHAALVYADTVACMIAGLRDPEVAAFATRMAGHGPREPFTGLSGSAANLALVLGFAGAALELDEGHYGAGGHPAAHAAAAALAIATAKGADDAARFAAFVVGYEAGARVGAASRLRPAAHPHGTWGAIGAAAAAACLTGRDAPAFAAILDIAASLGCATSVTAPMRGGSVRSAWIGVAARNGLTALDLFDAGVTGEPGGIEAVFGRVIGEAFDPARLEQGLGTRFEIAGNFMKLDASCRETQGALAAFRAARGAATADEIAAVEITTFADAARLCEQHPVNAMGARFSIPAVVATDALHGTIAPDAFTPQALAAPGLARLMSSVSVREDPAANAALPAARRCRAVVHHRDGSRSEATLESAPGDPVDPLSEAQLRDKFQRLLAFAGRDDAGPLGERLITAAAA